MHSGRNVTPGTVYTHPVLPAHLGPMKMPDLTNLPDELYIHYSPVIREGRSYRQFLGRGWIETSNSWHASTECNSLPGINGGAIRNIYSRRTLRPKRVAYVTTMLRVWP